MNCITCFYCIKKGYTSNKCRIKHYDVPSGRYVWIPIIKQYASNLKDPNKSLGTKIHWFCYAN